MKNKTVGSSFDSFLEEEGILDEVENGAVKKLIVLQIRRSLEENKMTKTELARRLETSRAAVDRLLDPENDSITLHTLKRAAEVIGKRLRLELV
ncbi:MAG: XRE family transcriptional regulator [Treponema sp.]|nr:XRE family transcriptional regulator [Treponema sp.]